MNAPNIRQALLHTRAYGQKDDGLTGKQVPYKSVTGLRKQTFGAPYDITDAPFGFHDPYADGQAGGIPGDEEDGPSLEDLLGGLYPNGSQANNRPNARMALLQSLMARGR